MSEKPKVYGLVLAAGRSTRMGQPKLQLRIGGQPFLERAIRTLQLGYCCQVLVVVNEIDEWVQSVVQGSGALVVVNPDRTSEQIASVRVGVRALPPDWDAVAILPVDLPLLQPASVGAVVRAFRRDGPPIVLPMHNDTAGHPVVIGRSLADALLEDPLEEGVRSFIMAHERDVQGIPVRDEGVLIDIDSPDEYRRYVTNP